MNEFRVKAYVAEYVAEFAESLESKIDYFNRQIDIYNEQRSNFDTEEDFQNSWQYSEIQTCIARIRASERLLKDLSKL